MSYHVWPAKYAGDFEDNGLWITFTGFEGDADNAYFFARNEFVVTQIPDKAVIHICAHSRYILYVNGILIGQGPETGSDLTCYYDSYNIATELQPGENYLALEICQPGSWFRTCVPGRPAFWCRLEADGVNYDNSNWLVCPDPSRLPGAHEFTFQMGYTVCRDLRKIPSGWQCGTDNYTGWDKGIEQNNPNNMKLRARDIPPLTHDIIRPAKLAGTGTVPESEEVPETQDFAKLLSLETHNANPTVFDSQSGLISAFPKGQGVYIIYDFGREVYGSAIAEIEAEDGTILDIAYGEMLEDGRIDAYYPFSRRPRAKTNSDGHRFADRHILAAGKNTVELRLQDRGCNCVQLVFRNYKNPLKLNDFYFENRVYPIGKAGAFHSDRPYYNTLWQMCSHTVRHCVGDRFMDCPWREQAFWINDFLVSNLYYFNLTADPALPRHSFDLAVDGFRKYSFMPAVYPAGDPLFFPSMPALWTLTLHEYYLYSGDDRGRRQLLTMMDEIMASYDKLGFSGNLVPNHDNWWNFIDIGYMDYGVELKGYTAILNAIVAAACKCAAELHDDQEKSALYTARSEAICAAMKAKLWDAENHRFRDSTELEHGFETFSVHPHAILLLFNLMPELNPELAAVLTDPAAIPAEPYFHRFVLEALAKTGKPDRAEKIIEQLWSRMVEMEFPTVWEIAKLGPKAKGVAQSLCHAFSCAPLGYASRVIAGIIPLKPGFKEFSFNPLSSITHFECTQPTPHGIIRVKRNNALFTIDVPQDTNALTPDGTVLPPGTHEITIKN